MCNLRGLTCGPGFKSLRLEFDRWSATNTVLQWFQAEVLHRECCWAKSDIAFVAIFEQCWCDWIIGVRSSQTSFYCQKFLPLKAVIHTTVTLIFSNSCYLFGDACSWLYDFGPSFTILEDRSKRETVSSSPATPCQHHHGRCLSC